MTRRASTRIAQLSLARASGPSPAGAPDLKSADLHLIARSGVAFEQVRPMTLGGATTPVVAKRPIGG